MPLTGKTVVVVGGTSGIGLAVAAAAAAVNAEVRIGGGRAERAAAAALRIGAGVVGAAVDLRRARSIAGFFADIARIDHLVITAQSPLAVSTLKPISAFDAAAARDVFEVKLFGMLAAVKAALPLLARDGSITLLSGAASRRTIAGHAVLGAVNGAVEAAGRQLARELAPIRVNVVSPGLTRTEAYDAMPAADREAMFAARAKALPVGRVGRPEDIALAVLHLMRNSYVTGTVNDVDGGGLLG